jgi:amino acid adenylation domain-containing protein
MQEGMLFHYLQDPEGDFYIERLSVELLGPVDRRVFEEAWKEVVERRDALRACFRWEEAKQPLQVVLKPRKPEIIFEDANAPSNCELFDLRQPPFRIRLREKASNSYLLILEFHHIILDGWSTGLVLADFKEYYDALSKGQSPQAASSSQAFPPFKTFVDHITKRSKREDQTFWKEYLTGYDPLPPLHQWLPLEIEPHQDQHPAVIDADVPEDLLMKLEQTATNQKVTLATILYTAWGILLQRYYDSDDVLFGTTVSGRQTNLEGIDQIAGLLINTIPLRIKSQDNDTLEDLLKKVNHHLNTRPPHAQTPIPEITKAAALPQGQEPFDTLVVIENYPLDQKLKAPQKDSNLEFKAFQMTEKTHYPLTLQINLFKELSIKLTLNPKKFSKTMAAQITEHYLQILHQVHRVHSVHWVHNVHQSPPQPLKLPPNPILKIPHHPQAQTIAQHLTLHGAKPKTIIAILTTRSQETIAGIHGIIQSGAAYLPIDPNTPPERINLILKDCNATLILCDKKYPNLPQDTIPILQINDLIQNPMANAPQPIEPTPDDPAYIITTSGSTGTPKGVKVPHRAVVNLLTSLQQKYPLQTGDVYLLKTSTSFDVSVSELFCTLMGTGTLAILPAGMEKDPQAMVEFMAQHRVTHVNFVPSMLKLFLSSLNETQIQSLHRLKYIFVAGEALQPDVVQLFRQTKLPAKLENLYGPTEATVYAAAYSLENWPPQKRVPIGKPLDNMTLSIRDRHGNIQPIGAPGELWIGGAGVAGGYLNRPQLTNERFVDGWYKSGDLCALLPDHNIQYLGRVDQQLKIRGFRIEPGEIETCLEHHPLVNEALVIPQPGPGGEPELAAYIAPSKPLDDPTPLKQHLAAQLPDYMIPAHYTIIDHIPRTTAGKPDRKALQTQGKTLTVTNDYVAPEKGIEKQVAEVWRHVLERERVGLDDNFFDCGGNSFSMIRLSARLKKTLGKSVPVTTLFQYPTVRKLTRYLEKGQAPSKQENKPANDKQPESISTKTNRAIAIIGMAGRFPGADTIDAFWDNIVNRRESIRFFTPQQLQEMGADDKLVADPQFVPAKGVLDNGDCFDPDFFGYSPQEALMMDPQMRVFHEVCWEALEDAGIDPLRTEDAIGLYAGATPNPHWEMAMLFDGEGEFLEKWQALQFCDKDYLATRVAYKLNLRGPAVAVQSACSTSLLAVAMSCEALLNNHCDAAIAGGVCVTIPDRHGYLYKEGMILSPDGHCRAFDKEAGGTLTGNGAGAVILKPLPKALETGDPIRAKIIGWGLNNDGSDKAGFTAPSSSGQAIAIRRAINMAGIDAAGIGLIEAHGSGTTLGDPIEVEGLIQAFETNRKNYCALGSVKTNIGHLDAAAGVAGLVKTVMALRHNTLPPSLHFNQSNPAINFHESPFFVNTTAKAWETDNQSRIAGVSSFGLGGTNVHVLLEEHRTKDQNRGQAPKNQSDYYLLPLSAQSDGQLTAVAGRLADYLKRYPETELEDVSYTLTAGRRQLSHRGIVVGRDRDDCITQLEAGDMTRRQTVGGDPFVVFMFSGQGNQYVNMCRDLYDNEPVFRREMEYCFDYLKNECDVDIQPVLYPNPSGDIERAKEAINQFIYTSPIKFAVEYGLAKLLLHWGVRPSAMIGHSFGEYVAATLAGVFTLKEALYLSALRGRLMHRVPEGAMLSCPLSEKELQAYMNENLWLAAVNGPSLCIVSGDIDAVEALKGELEGLGRECLSLKVPRAGHSAMMRPIVEEFQRAVAAAKPKEPHMPYISGLSGQWIKGSEATDPQYWGRHLEQTIRFYDGLTTLFQEADPVFIQVGPGRGLSLFVGRHPETTPQTPIVNMVRHHKEPLNDRLYHLQQIGNLWMSGIAVDWSPLFLEGEPKKLHLPTYPFTRKRFGNGGDVTPVNVGPKPGNSAIVKNPDMDRWFYFPSWRRAMPAVGQGADHETVLLLTEREGPLAHLAETLRDGGCRVIEVHTGDCFLKEGDALFVVNPYDQHSYEALLEDLESGEDLPGRIVHAWGLEGERGRSMAESPFYSVLYLIKALLKRQWHHPLRLDNVTTSAFDVTGAERLIPAHALVAGLSRVIPQENPHIQCRLIDMETPAAVSPRRREVGHLAAEILGGDDDAVVALRGRRRWVQDFQQAAIGGEGGTLLKPRGIYMVTGGLGDIGMILARRLAAECEARLALVGRSPFPARGDWDQWSAEDKVARAIGAIRDMEAAGARVAMFQADVSDLEQMKNVIAAIEREFGGLDGVIHGAGIVGEKNFRSLADVTAEECAEQFRAKVTGTVVLEELLRDRDYDFCLLMSSTSSVLGGLGFGAYAAANSFLDAMAAAHNRNDTPPWFSVNWDGWQIPGALERMNTDNRLGASIARLAMTPDEGFEVFRRILDSGFAGQVVQSTGDLERRMTRWGQVDEETGEPDSLEGGESNSRSRPRPRLQTPYQDPEGQTETMLAAIWADVLGFDKIGAADNFFELGGDSLKAVIVCSRIQKEFDVKVPLKDFFQEPTVAAIKLLMGRENQRGNQVPPVEIADDYPLSPVQERIALLHKMEPESVAYNLPTACRLTGELNRRRLQEAFSALVQRHESLRTSFHDTVEGMRQKIQSHVDFEVKWLEGTEPESLENLVEPFDLSEPPLFRVAVQANGPGEHLLLVDMPHIVSDGTSMAVMMKEWLDLYRGKTLPSKSVDYKDVVMWRRGEEQREAVARLEEFWRQELAGELPVMQLPLDYPRPPKQSFEGNLWSFKWDRDTASGLKRLAQQEGATLYMVLLSIHSILLSKLSGQEELLLGTPSAGRLLPELQGIVGMFINTVVLRQFPGGHLTFREFLKDVKSRALRALEHQDVPFETIVEMAGGSADQSRNPLFDAVFVLQNIGVPKIRIPGLSLEAFPVDSGTSKFDLTMRVEEHDDGLQVYLEYRTRLFKAETIARWAGYIRNIAKAALARPDSRLRDIEIMEAEEKEWLLQTLNGTHAAYPRAETIYSLFRKQVAIRPDAVALVGSPSNGAENQMAQLTYDWLSRRGEAVARKLQSMGSGTGGVVALLLDRRVDMLPAIIGTLQAGGAYLPMDPSLPQERIDYMVKDSGAGIVIDDAFMQALGEGSPEGMGDETTIAQAGDPAYVIYTSGTTGKPKGVVIDHYNVVRLLFNDRDLFDFSERDVWTLFHSYCFDFSVWEMYGALLKGGKLVMVPQMTARHGGDFLELLRRLCVTVLNQTPSAFYSLTAEEGRATTADLAVRMVIFGGEALQPVHLRHWSRRYPRSRLVNMYGITETTVHVTYKEIGPAEIENDISNIGGPIPTLACYVVDRHGNLCPTGVAGELVVGGDGVARGYLNRPELTDEKFVRLDHPAPGSRFYRSGDLARVLPNGDMEYLGRIDHQVKIRGYRIELGEVESRLLSHEEVREAVVLAHKNGGNESSLCAYFVPEPDSGLQDGSSLLRDYLLARLPEYMVPSYFIPVEEIPLTGNGKVDRRSLPEPGVIAATEHTRPRNPVEKALARVWSGVLGIDEELVGIDSNFFELGGHSLKATLVVQQIHKELGVDIPLREMFRTPVIRQLAVFVDKQAAPTGGRTIEPVEKRDYYPVSSSQERMYILNKLKGDDTSDNTPQALEIEGALDVGSIKTTARQLVERHEALRTSFVQLDGAPVQRIHAEVELDIPVVEAEEGEVHDLIRRFIRPFDLSSAPLLRVQLLKLSEQRHILLYDIHHIVRDGTSTEIFFREFVRLYRGEGLPRLKIQYKDFAVWHQRNVLSGDLAAQEDYWLGVFDGEPPRLELPSDFPRPSTQSFEGATKEFSLDEELSRRIQTLAADTGCTLFMALLAAYTILLSKYSGQEDVVVGTPVAGRPHADVRDVIGMFVNTLAIRNYPSAEKRFDRFLAEVRDACLEAFENQDLPFDHLVSRLGIEPDPARQPLFDTMFVVQNVNRERGWTDVAMDGLVMRAYPFEDHVAQFDMITHVFEREGEIAFKMLYCTKLFKPETIDSLVERFVEILESVSSNPETLIRDIDISHGFCRQEIQLPEAEFVF